MRAWCSCRHKTGARTLYSAYIGSAKRWPTSSCPWTASLRKGSPASFKVVFIECMSSTQ